MSLTNTQRVWVQRGVAAVLAVIMVPLLVALGTIAEDAPIVEGEPAPRTVFADETVRIVDQEATEEARGQAFESVEPVLRFDNEAQREIVTAVRQVFSAVRAARTPEPSGGATGPGPSPSPQATVPSEEAQLQELRSELPFLDANTLRTLIGLSSSDLTELEQETIAAAQELARQRIAPDEVEQVLEQRLPTELAVRDFPNDTAQTVAGPLIREVMQPTMTVDREATQAARERAASEVPEVVQSWREGQPIVREGEVVEPIELRALEQLGLEGSDPRIAYARGVAAMGVITLIAIVYLRLMQPKVWHSGRKVLLLASLVTGYALLVTGVGLVADAFSDGWWFGIPAGAFAMLAAILIHPVVGIATMLPAVVLVQLVAPQTPAVPMFVAAVVLVSVPLVTRIGSRGDLRGATLRTTLIYPAIAFAALGVFGPREELLVGLGAAVAGGVVTAMIVQGVLPFLETSFRLPTVTALLDLADRNHPLLRELEQKALGSYNHSVMVASLVERACREIGANALLGSVASLYHDIGKVRQPHFFIENQQGIRNPHDDLEPEVSAIIIQNHVVDGVEMAREYRLPPEVVAAIGSHHGTMLVTYFYRKALDRAGGDIDKVDVEHYRYKGTKPRSKEAAVLLMADCCEAATRSAAMDRGTLPRSDIEGMVDRLIQERVDDGQFDHCDLTFAEMTSVRNSIVEALVGIYHPRIAYPGPGGAQQGPSGPDPRDSEQAPVAESVGS